MFKLSTQERLSESQARDLASAIERNAEVVQRNSADIREIFSELGYNFDVKKFTSVSSSTLAMLIIYKIKRSGKYNKDESVSTFINEVDEYYLTYVDVNSAFESGLLERESLKREAAIWAAEKYFGEEPTTEQADLFYERADTFVEFITDANIKASIEGLFS